MRHARMRLRCAQTDTEIPARAATFNCGRSRAIQRRPPCVTRLGLLHFARNEGRTRLSVHFMQEYEPHTAYSRRHPVFVFSAPSILCRRVSELKLHRRAINGRLQWQGSRVMNAVRTYSDLPRCLPPVLSTEEEAALFRRWQEHHDVSAAERLIRSHLRLVAGIAMRHRGRGVRTRDLIGEGSPGLMHAVCRYDPTCSSGFATYATWWVQAAIQEILRATSAMPAMTAGSVVKLPPRHSPDRKLRGAIHFVS